MASEPEIQSLIQRASQGDQQALGDLFRRFEGRLRRLVDLRMDRRMQGRVGASDVLESLNGRPPERRELVAILAEAREVLETMSAAGNESSEAK